MKTAKAKLRVGDQFRLSPEALENYGEKYEGKTFTVSHVSTAYMPAKEFYEKGKPNGFHPGYDTAAGGALYDAQGLTFSVYDWEVTPV